MPLKVILIDDDPAFADRFAAALRSEFEVTLFVDADGVLVDSGLRALAEADALVVDLHLPGLDGISAFQKIRAASSRMPIAFLLTSDRREAVRMLALERGFLDVLYKDTQPQEIFLQIRNSWEKLQARQGEWTLVPELLELKHATGVIQLTPVEYRIMGALLKLGEPGTPCDREELVRVVWRDTKISSQTVNSHVFNLSRKLEPLGYCVSVDRNQGVALKPGR